ncbi:hypothetical protein QA649_08895 [Bradyrhizobium sp. CB1717]|uniref:hypothetical protein n=1 Tax=Bradyrhizobium sp. CB1717 TaxID=3039154 RepID=UPI0024B12331|nr:hypothetical protein [Bradyrhizobium sp. CB1717]WFU26307.1 hypothetical protein QA649_08895 [Bradyrhizobium sp. CB1717]
MSEFRDKASLAMTSELALQEASTLIRELAGRGPAGESVKSALRRVGRQLKNWNPSRIRDVWYQDCRVSIRGEELEQLRALTKRRVQDKADTDALEELRARISRLEALLESADPSFHSPDIAALGDIRRKMG